MFGGLSGGSGWLQVHLVARMALLLETLHRNKRTHGNLTPHHVVADTSGGSPAAYTLLDLSCSRSIQGARAAPLQPIQPGCTDCAVRAALERPARRSRAQS